MVIDYCYTLFNWNTDVNVTKKTLPIVVYMKTDFQTGRPILLMCLNLPDRKFKALKTVDVSGATNTSILTDVQMALLRLQLEGYFSDTTVIHALSMLVVRWIPRTPVSIEISKLILKCPLYLGTNVAQFYH